MVKYYFKSLKGNYVCAENNNDSVRANNSPIKHVIRNVVIVLVVIALIGTAFCTIPEFIYTAIAKDVGFNIQAIAKSENKNQTMQTIIPDDPSEFPKLNESPDVFKQFPQPNTYATPPYVPPFTHFIIIYRENHVFDGYLGDFASAGWNTSCNAQVNTGGAGDKWLADVPYLHYLAKNNSLFDSYSTGTIPPSGPNHWYLFAAETHMSSAGAQTGYYPTGGTQFDRMLLHRGNNVTFLVNGDIYWFVLDGLTEYAGGSPTWLPPNRPGTGIPEELNYNNYTNASVSTPDDQITHDFLTFVNQRGLPTFTYVELFNDHPTCTAARIKLNDYSTNLIVQKIMSNPSYNKSTVICITEDDTQNGANDQDHVSNTYRVPLVVVADKQYMKTNYISHVAYNTTNVIALAERVCANVDPTILPSTTPSTKDIYPMCTNDATALQDPLEDIWRAGTSILALTASASTDHGMVPLMVNFTASASGGTSPYNFSWDFGDGSPVSYVQNPSHSYTTGGSYVATITLKDAGSTTKTQSFNIYTSGASGTFSASIMANPSIGQVPLSVNFISIVNGGTTPYKYKWDFGDGGSSTVGYPVHKYIIPGSYIITLDVSDSSTNQKNVTCTEIVSPMGGPGIPYVQGSATPQTGQAPLLVTFTGQILYGNPPYNYTWNFGDGTSAYVGNTTHRYTAGGTFVANLTVRDTKGSYSYLCTIIVTPPPPGSVVATASAIPTSGIAPLNVAFTGSATGGTAPYTYSWNFGDGSATSSLQNPSHQYTVANTYTATLTAKDSLLATGTDSVVITVSAQGQLKVTATANPTSGTVPLNVTFTGGASNGTAPYSYSWHFGDGTTSALQNPTHIYTYSNNFVAILNVTDSTSKSGTKSVTISVTSASSISVTASANRTSGNAPLPVTFSGSATGGITPYTYSWTFGDGGTSTLQNPSHTYTAVGPFQAKLTVTDSASNSGNKSVTITVSSPPGYPTAHASATPKSGPAPLTVTFTGSADNGTAPYTYTWTFGDGGTSTTQSPTHAYNNQGTFAANLTVTDHSSNSGKATLVITVSPGSSFTVSISANVTSGISPIQVGFTSTLVGGTSPYDYHWDFGDQGVSGLPNPTHWYTNPGTYNVALKVTDNDGNQCNANMTIKVLASSNNNQNSNNSFNLLYSPMLWLVAVVAITVAIIAIILVTRKKKKDTPPPQPQFPYPYNMMPPQYPPPPGY